MSNNNPNWQIFAIDLTIAGQQDIPALFSYFRLIDAVNGAGVTNLDAIVNVQPRRTGGDAIPMRLNSLVKLPGKTDFIRVSWPAQPGIIAKLFMSDQDNDSGIEVEAPPTKQLVTTSIGSVLVPAAVAVGAAAVQLAAASASRQSVTILNNSANDIFIGDVTVTVVNGMRLVAGQALTIDKTTAAIFAIAAGAGNDVRVLTEA